MFNQIGADVEVFAVDKQGQFKSLCGLVGGTKEEPKQLDGYPEGFCVQEDNVSLEFNIPPATRKNNFILNIQHMVSNSEAIIQKHGFEISKQSSGSFSKLELSHPNALIFGCEPDYDAWKMIENKKPHCDDASLRTAGGHIHVDTTRNMVEVVRNMDLFLGVPSVILDNSEASIIRRKLYGKAGAMRPKPYGLEYRTLSNFWVFSEELIGWVFDNTAKSVRYSGTIKKTEGKDIQNCINTGDVNAAKHICEHFGITY